MTNEYAKATLKINDWRPGTTQITSELTLSPQFIHQTLCRLRDELAASGEFPDLLTIEMRAEFGKFVGVPTATTKSEGATHDLG